jgi:glutamine synthetase type III
MVPCIEANCTPGQPNIDAFYSETPPGTEENFFVVRGSGRFFTGIALMHRSKFAAITGNGDSHQWSFSQKILSLRLKINLCLILK